jgi:hypothetical protein
MVCFQTKNPDLGNFLEGFRLENITIFLAIWNILRTFGIFYDHLVHFVFIWHIFSGFGIMYQEKSGNPAAQYNKSFWKGSEAKPDENAVQKSNEDGAINCSQSFSELKKSSWTW